MRLIILLLLIPYIGLSQSKQASEFGFRYIKMSFQSDPVDILVKSKSGEEEIKKPIFLFCEGSLPQPLIKTDGETTFGVYPFQIPEALLANFHLVIISKPYIPLIADKSTLGDNFMYFNETGSVPSKYRERNYLDYYVKRNIEVINYLHSLSWVDKSQLVVSGHSQGSDVAAQLAYEFDKVTHLIYSAGNPFGRIMDIIAENRRYETDSLPLAERSFDWWQDIVSDSSNLQAPNGGDSNKNTYDFSKNHMNELLALDIPVLTTYGTIDYCSIFNDYLRIEAIRKGKSNFTFKAYIGTEHNYFYLNPDGSKNYDVFTWDEVAEYWTSWVLKNNTKAINNR
ncbi:MAG: hypothetical protein OCD76_23640 [Reichenbachiella sp.]